MRRYAAVLAPLAAAGFILSGAAGTGVAWGCALDLRPSARADGQIDRVNMRQPTNSAELAVWSPFVFARAYAVRRPIALTEDRRELARSLLPDAMRRPWRWRFGDGFTAYGWTVRHAYARSGRWRITVDAYLPATGQWYNFDQVQLTVRRSR